MTTYRRIKSVELTIAIIKFLARQDEPVSGNVISKGLGTPVGTIMCHLVTLEEGDLVKRTGEQYSLGVYIAAIREVVKKSLELTIKRAQKDLDFINNN